MLQHWKANAPSRAAVVMAVLSAVFLIYYFYFTYHSYLSESFAYHDLGLINDFLTSIWSSGRLFFIHDYGISHFSVHITPTMVLLMPLYRLISSGYLLVAIGVVAALASCLLFSSILKILAKRMGFMPHSLLFMQAASFVFFASNRYIERNIFAAHYELIAIFFTSLSLYYLILGSANYKIWISACLALGVRTDIGLFSSCFYLMTYFTPKHWWPNQTKPVKLIFSLVLFSICWLLINVTVISPIVGASEAHVTRFWAHWGSSWSEVFTNFALNPQRLFAEIRASGLKSLNQSVHWLNYLNPISGILSNIPGLLLYTASSIDKSKLRYYNSGFLLPGIYLGAVYGFAILFSCSQLIIARLSHDSLRTKRAARFIPWIALSLAPIYGIKSTYRTVKDRYQSEQDLGGDLQSTNVRNALASLAEIDVSITKVAAGFKNTVFIPNQYQIYNLRHAFEADAILIERKDAGMILTSDQAAQLLNELSKNPKFYLAATFGDISVFIAKRI